ncbi:cellulose synthase/poly-beta-1,6-N-acetylglucosamine synthase-like glycosyltransferase [Arcticibacter pallidicorallinus]|uniref:Cellulose synthase/poly-beta-1,6-N-acetylglucosamine synthase-like glycosyltransferase n=1 Tax=Arcticibacter pallidicorallinus TaxID=1259464 RepID=A0A2T0U3D9_9SPHI|nr:glycosyltransferase family 2 protein [Arcticibacter pallidicorallinus]PRY52421.1 cellulose synthase/poly-beta-1,6-N-acetylglucosamine synthase-like glycosyltransferase [Arcticibacter pallidicorallinus]
MEIAFWVSVFIVLYTFIGYGVLLYILVRLKRLVGGNKPEKPLDTSLLPSCTLIIAAYNEQEYMHDKIRNTLDLKYPDHKLEIIFVTDGSTDQTPDIVAQYPQITHLYSPSRHGKIHAVHRAIEQVSSDVIVFTDANTFLNEDALQIICRHYEDQSVGAVAGEKRVFSGEEADASSAGEGFYWKYESALKKWDSELHSVVGAAGELFSIRRSLYEPVGSDIILDDFMISMLIAMRNYRIVYEPDAYAIENASADVKEELKRKIRIAAGGIQSIIKLLPLLNIFRYGVLSFQYISHRVLRWTITPFLLILIFVLNLLLVSSDNQPLYTILLILQLVFYVSAVAGFLLEKKQIKVKVLFVPYYFCVMNYAVFRGIIRYCSKKQSAKWEKSKRKDSKTN